MTLKIFFYWMARLVAAIVLIQTLYFKFSGATESVYISTTVGMEPWGRIGIGILELLAAILLLINRTTWMGAFLCIGLMLGAIGMHLTLLGIEVQGDGGLLFGYAILVSLSAIVVLVMDEEKIADFMKRIKHPGD